VEVFRELLERQRFQFLNNWLCEDNIKGKWSAFNEIIKRKNMAIQTQISSLQTKIVVEDKPVEARTANLEKSNPTPCNSCKFLRGYSRLKVERDNVVYYSTPLYRKC